MENNLFVLLIPSVLIGFFLFDLLVETLNIRSLRPNLPSEMKDVYDEKEYRRSQQYLKESTIFGLIRAFITTSLILIVLFSGSLNIIDQFARSMGNSEIIQGIVFLLVTMTLSQMSSLPFSIYFTFVLEEKYGFNKSTINTFILDHLKSFLLTLIIGVPVFALLILVFQQLGQDAWIIGWILVTIIQLVLYFFAPTLILPLFNKFVPLEEGKLRHEIERFANKQNFHLQGIYTMDGSKRSTKSNAFFTGFGKYKRIALYDTLIDKHSIPELVSILAHEIGHYKKRHIWKLMVLSILTLGLMLFVLSRFINSTELTQALRVEETSIYLTLMVSALLFEPIGAIIGIVANYFSRQFEYEADVFAVKKYKHPKAFISALKKLSVNNLSNLTPHPLKVLVDYSHPPILDRIKAIKDK